MMKTAKEMKQKTLQNCEVVKWVEANVPQMIDSAAADGKTYIEIMTDDIEAPLGVSRGFITDRVVEYVTGFGYCVHVTSNNKKIAIDWNIMLDK